MEFSTGIWNKIPGAITDQRDLARGNVIEKDQDAFLKLTYKVSIKMDPL